MTFGVQFTNGSNTVVLDSEYARLSVLCSGRYTPNSDSGRGTTVVFPAPITTQEPPLVFIKPDATGLAGLTLFRATGSAGNWTGFYFYGQGIGSTASTPNGVYFAAAFAATPTAAFGMRIWDASGKLLYDPDTPSALFTRSFQTWTYERSDTDPQGSYRNWYKVIDGLPAANEFVLASNFSMYMVGGNASGRQVSLFWDFSANTLRAMTGALSNPYNFWLSTIFAKKVV